MWAIHVCSMHAWRNRVTKVDAGRDHKNVLQIWFVYHPDQIAIYTAENWIYVHIFALPAL